MSSLAELLSTVEVFEKLTDKDRQDLSQLAIRRSVKKGDILLQAVQKCPDARPPRS